MRGFVRQLISAAGVVVAIIVAYFFYKDVAVWVRGWVPLETIQSYDQYRMLVEGLKLDVYLYNAVAFLLLFWGVKIGLAIVGRVLHLITLVPGLNALNKWSGALLGMTEGLVLVIVTLHVLAMLPSDQVQAWMDHSTLADTLLGWGPVITDQLTQWWNQET